MSFGARGLSETVGNSAQAGAALRNAAREGVNKLIGAPAGTRGDPISERFLEHATGSGKTLAHPLASLYVINFEPRFGRCLGSDPAKIIVETRLIERGRDALGPYQRELSRSTREVLVKQELAAMALTLDLNDPTIPTILMGLFSSQASQATMEAIRGVGALMNSSTDFNGLAIRTFEARLAEYIRQVQLR